MFRVLRDFVVKHPRLIGVPLATICGAPFADLFLVKRAYWMKRKPIDDVLEAGTKPTVFTPPWSNIDRSAIVDLIRDPFVAVPKGKSRDFGVVLGPTGTGKSDATRKACNGKQTAGVLYCEIVDFSFFSKDLAKTIGMSLEPTSLIDVILSYLIQLQRGDLL